MLAESGIRDLLGDPPMQERTPAAVLRAHAELRPDDTWLMFDSDHYSFGRANELVNRIAHGLLSQGIGLGDPVAMYMTNCAEYVMATMALAKIGAVQVPVNTAFKGDFLARPIRHCRARAIIADGALVERLRTSLGAELGLVFARGLDPAQSTGQVMPFEVLSEHPDTEPDIEVDARDVSAVMYTSGTTGPAKGAMLSHHYWYTASRAIVEARDVHPDDRFYASLPMFHAGVWLYTIYAGLLTGLPVGLDATFSVRAFWDRVRYYGATQLFTAGAMHLMVWNQEPQDDDADNPARVWVAVPLPSDLWDSFKKRFGIDHLIFQYGQTECVPVSIAPAGAPIKPGSAGWPLPHFEVQVVDDDDTQLPPGTAGEIVVRPKLPNTMFSGYLHNPDATLHTWRNLWHHTGDIGVLDAHGELFFVDRKQDYLRRRGENISSFEVEAVVDSHPAVAGSAAHAVASELTEDELKITVVLKPGASLSHEELARHCNQHLPYFAVPRYIEYVDELPVTPTVRTQKFLLRERGVTATTWDAEVSNFKVER
jgi:crotonobetaine/carnitine-CoA ligase